MAAQSRRTLVTLLSCLTLMSRLCRSEFFIPGLFEVNLTAIASSEKNSGKTLSDDLDDDGLIMIGATAENKGAHLGSAFSILKSLNDSKSQVLLDNSKFGASISGQSLAEQNRTGTNVWTDSLYPYLEYFKGTVMSQLGPTKPFFVAPIFYGKKWTPRKRSFVRNFLNSITPTKRGTNLSSRTVENWWKITTNYYYDAQGRNISRDVKILGEYNDPNSAYPRGSKAKPLRNRDLKGIIVNALNKRFKTSNTRTVFLVLTDEDTSVQDFCTTMCTFHSTFRHKEKTIIYLFAGNPATLCPFRCTFKYFTSRYKPANDLGVDAVINWVSHGLTAVATNTLSGRKVNPGWLVKGTTIENSDFCELDFGYIGFTKTYAMYNVRGNSDMRFLIQRNWNRKLQACTMTANGRLDTALPITPT